MPINFFDMFAGIGGFRSGLEAVGGFECVGYCEIDKYAKQAYEAMYDTKGELYFDDARKINPESLPDIDLICGGFPCQSFSIAGERRGFDDVRGTLFFEIARIASIKRPKYLFLENVPGLLNHDQGRTFQTILITLDELGYDVVWQVCNSKNFGVPQSRKRVYIIGYNREKCRGEILSFTQTNPKTPVQRLSGKEGERIYSTNGVSVTLTSSGGGFAGKTGMYCLENDFDEEFKNSCGIRIISKTKSGYQIAYPGDSIDTAFSGQNSRRGRVGNKIAHTLTISCTQAYYFIDMNPEPKITDIARCITARYDSGISNRKAEHSGILVDGVTEEEMNNIFDGDAPFVMIFKDKYGEVHFGRIRKLTPLECWRLQGFTDEQFYKVKVTGLSDSRLYKMAGNAVTVPVISAIGKMLLDVESRNN
ncbi:MAG: DNA (cytosine-5-)-methyltransferase [Ruminococcus sp.]|nr:DNA (cytosine-5-)-methyltransferase [Ruminococcus sp.]